MYVCSSDTSLHAKKIPLDGVSGDGSIFIHSFIHSFIQWISFRRAMNF